MAKLLVRWMSDETLERVWKVSIEEGKPLNELRVLFHERKRRKKSFLKRIAVS